MDSEGCCSKGFEYFVHWVVPEGLVHRRLGNLYENHPVMSRVVATPVALISGIVKVLLFPVICLVGVIAMPCIALAKYLQGDQTAGAWLKASGFCLLGFTSSVIFLGITSYYTSLLGASALFLGVLSVSITFHVHKLVKEPVGI